MKLAKIEIMVVLGLQGIWLCIFDGTLTYLSIFCWRWCSCCGNHCENAKGMVEKVIFAQTSSVRADARTRTGRRGDVMRRWTVYYYCYESLAWIVSSARRLSRNWRASGHDIYKPSSLRVVWKCNVPFPLLVISLSLMTRIKTQTTWALFTCPAIADVVFLSRQTRHRGAS